MFVGDEFCTQVESPVELFRIGRKIIGCICFEFRLGRVCAHISVFGFSVEISPEQERYIYTGFQIPSAPGLVCGLYGQRQILVIDFGYDITGIDTLDIAPVIQQFDDIVFTEASVSIPFVSKRSPKLTPHLGENQRMTSPPIDRDSVGLKELICLISAGSPIGDVPPILNPAFTLNSYTLAFLCCWYFSAKVAASSTSWLVIACAGIPMENTARNIYRNCFFIDLLIMAVQGRLRNES